MSFLSSFSKKKSLNLSKRSPAVRSLVELTLAYLKKRAAENPKAQIRPAMLADGIGVNEMLALTALGVLEKAGITKSHIGLYCDTTMQPIIEAGGIEAASDNRWCDACGQEHCLDAGEMVKDLYFTFDPKALAEIKEAA